MPLDLTRSLLSVLLPGFVACAPWLLLMASSVPQAGRLYEDHALPFHVAAFALVTVVGTIIEGLGGYLEKSWDSAVAKTGRPTDDDDWVDKDWLDYLSRDLGGQSPVGYRYLSRKVTALYFELGMMQSTPVSAIGFAALSAQYGASCWIVVLIAGVGVAAGYLFSRFARDTHSVICHTRARMNDRLSNPA